MDSIFNENSAQVKKYKQIKEIRSFSAGAGLCIIGFCIISELIGIIVAVFGLQDLYYNNQLFYQCFSLVGTMLSICIPFLLMGSLFKKKTDIDIVPLGKPTNFRLAFLAVPAGVMLCLAGSMITAYLTMFLDAIGIKLSAPDMASPTGGYALIIYMLRLTVSAAVMEEIVIRGVIMQPLRKYGNWFAILMSAMIFAFLHCNLIQAPFAFLAGIAIGYFTIVTGTVWTGIFIHLINNGISAITAYYIAIGQEDKGNIIGSLLIYLMIALGIICLVAFRKARGSFSIDKKPLLTKGERAKAYLITIPMIIAFALICYYTHFYIEL